MLNNIIKLYKVENSRNKIILICGLLLFTFYPLWMLYNFTNEIIIQIYNIEITGKVIRIKTDVLGLYNTSILVNTANRHKQYTINYIPSLEYFSIGSEVTVLYNHYTDYVSSKAPLWKRLLYSEIQLILSGVIVSLILLALKNKISKKKMDGLIK